MIGTPSTLLADAPLSGNVRGSAVILTDGLEKIVESSKSLQKAVLLVVSECNRKLMAPAVSPNMLPNGVVTPAVPFPTGMLSIGKPLAPRSTELQYYVSQILHQYSSLKNLIDASIIPEHLNAEHLRTWSRIHELEEHMQIHTLKLQSLVASPPYNNKSIVNEASMLYEQITEVNKLSKQLKKSL